MKIKKVFSKRGAIFIKDMIIAPIAYLISKFYKKKELWIIAERYDEARDNGYHLFKYINNKCDCKNIFYIIDKNSKDFENINEFQNIVQFGSFKHHLYYWRATKLISTHINGYMPNENVYKYMHRIIKHNGKKIFLQHGIIKDCLPQLFYKNTKLDLFVCGAKPEYEYIKNTFGYKEHQVQYLGLCRYDNLLKNKTKKQILIMPTFRMEYYVAKDEKLTKEDKRKFINSKYYKVYDELLKSNKLIQKLEKEKIELIFYPHYEMQKYIELFKDIPKCVKIAKEREYDIQTLLKESKLLITDYSSVFFDFSYMEKPIIYFQFDKEEYRKKHYKEGYFSYKNDGFGPIETTVECVVNKIMQYIDTEYEVEKEYLNRNKKFFLYRDTNNCKRNYDAIRRL